MFKFLRKKKKKNKARRSSSSSSSPPQVTHGAGPPPPYFVPPPPPPSLFRPPSTRNFVPPAQQDEDRIATTGQLIRSWSRRTTRLCLQNPTKSLSEEVSEKDPGDWVDVFCKELLDLWKQDIACDVTFRVNGAGPETVVRAHRCIVASNTTIQGFSKKMFSQLAPEKDEIIVDDTIFTENPEYLRALIGICYGAKLDDSTYEQLCNSGYYTPERDDRMSYLRGLSKIDPSVTDMPDDIVCMPDVCIVGSSDASVDSGEDYREDCHKAIICAHSEYFRSALTHEGWSIETLASAEGKVKLLVRLDSNQFTHDTVRELVSACYYTPLDVCEEPLESILQLIDGATYLGMKGVSLMCEEGLSMFIDPTNLADMIEFAQDARAQRLLLDCHKYLCRNLTSARDAGSLKHLKYSHLEALLQSDFIETPEDDIMETLLAWSEETEASYEETVDLIKFVRLPFVPVDSTAMAAAVAKNLVSDDMLLVCRLFQTDGDYRATMINSETMYRPRQPQSITDAMRMKMFFEPPEPPELPELLSFPEQPMVCRMLGTVNGREGFHKISSVYLAESANRLVCTFPHSKSLSCSCSFDFDGLETPHMPASSNVVTESRVNRASLEHMQVEDARQLLTAMLLREDEIRLHPRVQTEFERIGENESELSNFVDALQARVASEFNVDADVGTELIRSASTLFPETAELVHYVRYNRCFEGSLCVGDAAPDVELSTLAGKPTTLWTELDLHRSSDLDGLEKAKPVVIVGASYT